MACEHAAVAPHMAQAQIRTTGAIRAVRSRIQLVAAATLVGTLACACSGSSTPAKTGTSGGSTPAGGQSSSASAAPATRSVANPTVTQASPGTAKDTVAPRTIRTLAPVALSSTAHYPGGVTAAINDVHGTTVKARLPGQIGGRVVAFRLSIHNASTHRISARQVVINVFDSTGDPVTEVTTPPANPVSGVIAAGGRADGTYLFSIAPQRRSHIRITVSYQPGQPIAQFAGEIS